MPRCSGMTHVSLGETTSLVCECTYSGNEQPQLDWYRQVAAIVEINSNTHTHLLNGPLSGTTQVSRYEKGKTNLDFTEARVSECQWHQLGCMLVCTSLQTDNHTSIPLLSFLQAGCPSCRPTNSVKALKALNSNSNCN